MCLSLLLMPDSFLCASVGSFGWRTRLAVCYSTHTDLELQTEKFGSMIGLVAKCWDSAAVVSLNSLTPQWQQGHRLGPLWDLQVAWPVLTPPPRLLFFSASVSSTQTQPGIPPPLWGGGTAHFLWAAHDTNFRGHLKEMCQHFTHIYLLTHTHTHTQSQPGIVRC